MNTNIKHCPKCNQWLTELADGHYPCDVCMEVFYDIGKEELVTRKEYMEYIEEFNQ